MAEKVIKGTVNSGAGNQEYIICDLSSKCSFTLIFVEVMPCCFAVSYVFVE
jgi:hypothetical protein